MKPGGISRPEAGMRAIPTRHRQGSGDKARPPPARRPIAAGLDLLFSLAALVAASSSVILADFLKTLLEFIAVLIAWLALRRDPARRQP